MLKNQLFVASGLDVINLNAVQTSYIYQGPKTSPYFIGICIPSLAGGGGVQWEIPPSPVVNERSASLRIEMSVWSLQKGRLICSAAGGVGVFIFYLGIHSDGERERERVEGVEEGVEEGEGGERGWNAYLSIQSIHGSAGCAGNHTVVERSVRSTAVKLHSNEMRA